MTHNEFAELTAASISAEDFGFIHTVYQYHPVIPDDGAKAKRVLADLWNIGGMRLMRDMWPTAFRVQAIEEQAQSLRVKLSDLAELRRRISDGLE